MTELEIFQAYWWLIIAVLGAALVFLLFVQGGQSMICCSIGDNNRQLIVNSLGRKWELTFTTLVVFGGAFFASFPLFYSTSFGGAYWLWMLILLSFVLQAVSYEFRRKRGNLYGTRTYNLFLMFNGLFGCVLLGVAVGMLFFGAEFTVTKTNILDPVAPVISQWTPTRGLEAIACWKNLLLGFAVFFLARTQAALYFINNIAADREFSALLRKKVLINGLVFAVLFVAFVAVLLFADGVRQAADGSFVEVANIYLDNLMTMWPGCDPVDRHGHGALRHLPLGSVRGFHQRHMVQRHRNSARRSRAVPYSRVREHGLLPLADRCQQFADHRQQFIVAVHAQSDELCLDPCAVCACIYLVCMAQDEQCTSHYRGTRQRVAPVLTSHP